MKIEEAINIYKNLKYLPSQCHIKWLKENFNPIIKSVNANLKINWACGSCIKTNMNILINWLDKKQNPDDNG